MTADLKGMILGALAGAGGQDYLQRQAEQNPVAFMGLVGKVLPLQVTGQNGTPIAVDFRWADATPSPQQVIEAEPDMPLGLVFVEADAAE